jgi:hypothetical protein
MWPYFTLRDGKLFDERSRRVYREAPLFPDIATAEQWLVDHDLRGNVR